MRRCTATSSRGAPNPRVLGLKSPNGRVRPSLSATSRHGTAALAALARAPTARWKPSFVLAKLDHHGVRRDLNGRLGFYVIEHRVAVCVAEVHQAQAPR